MLYRIAGICHDIYQFPDGSGSLSARVKTCFEERTSTFQLLASGHSEIVKLCLHLFDFKPGQEFNPNDKQSFKGFNEFVSALDIALLLDSLGVSKSYIATIVMAIAATIPFVKKTVVKGSESLEALKSDDSEAKEDEGSDVRSDENPVEKESVNYLEVLYGRLKSANLALTTQEASVAKLLTLELAMQDVWNFAGKEGATEAEKLRILISNSFGILYEMVRALRSDVYTVKAYAQAMLGLKRFYGAFLEQVFLNYEDIYHQVRIARRNDDLLLVPDDETFGRMLESAKDNLSNGSHYYQAKLISSVTLYAILLVSGVPEVPLKELLCGKEAGDEVYLKLSEGELDTKAFVAKDSQSIEAVLQVLSDVDSQAGQGYEVDSSPVSKFMVPLLLDVPEEDKKKTPWKQIEELASKSETLLEFVSDKSLSEEVKEKAGKYLGDVSKAIGSDKLASLIQKIRSVTTQGLGNSIQGSQTLQKQGLIKSTSAGSACVSSMPTGFFSSSEKENPVSGPVQEQSSLVPQG